ncbi:MAG: DUF4058 family protein [Gemmataceae bacterium]|nr:DUF4058 family protein [Gemmataceae bacterium]
MNPFPGMNPNLEDPAFWRDFHARFILHLCESIADGLPDAYEGRIDESVRLVQMPEELVKLVYPDVAISHDSSNQSRPRGSSGIATLDPQTITQAFYEEVRETRVEILHRPERDLVTVIELLSSANKTGDGFLQYSAKRSMLLPAEAINLLELDFLIQGQRLKFPRPLPQGDYLAYLTRAERRVECQVYAWSIRDRLPTLPVPLRAPDPDIHVDLQAVFDTTFQRGRYARSLNYGRELPGLSEETRAWARDRIQAASAQK